MSEFIGTKLTMNLGERSYDIIIKSGSLENLYQFARLDRRVAVVTDSGVPAQYAQRVADQCKDARIITVPQGEASKSFKILESVLRQMLDFGMGRGDLVVAVGGGVVGDLAGSTQTPISGLLDRLSGGGNEPQPATANGAPINYAPVYNFNGAAPTKDDLVEAERMSQAEFNEMMEQWQRDNDRKRF